MKKVVEFIKKNKMVIIGVVAFLAVLATITIFIAIKNKKETMEYKLEVIGREFYEQYYYDRLKASQDNVEEFLKNFSNMGIRINLASLERVRLYANVEMPKEELLKLDAEHEEKFKQFKAEDGTPCDPDKTQVIIYPKAPYKQKNYDIKVQLSCENQTINIIEPSENDIKEKEDIKKENKEESKKEENKK